MDWMRTGGWLNGARRVHIVQVHALFTNPNTHKIVPNGGAAVGERHIQTMKVNGHNSYAHHVIHIILSAQYTCVPLSPFSFCLSLFVLFVCWLQLIVGWGTGTKYYVATNDDDDDKPSKYEKERLLHKIEKIFLLLFSESFAARSTSLPDLWRFDFTSICQQNIF